MTDDTVGRGGALSGPSDPTRLSVLDRIKQWWRLLWRSTQERPTPPPTPNAPKSMPQPSQPRYEVQNSKGKQVAENDTLAGAHKQWQEQTGQEGRIIDRETGQDVTPEPDNNGRYVVLQEDGTQVGSFDDRKVAETTWEDSTNRQGKIIDMQTHEDVTPKTGKPKLNDAQLRAVLKLTSAGRGLGGQGNLTVDPDVVARMIHQINKLDIPVFNITNLRGKGKHTPTKTVPIVRRKVTIETVKKMVEVEMPGPKAPNGRIFVPYPTDDPDTLPVRRTGELSQMSRRDMALPRHVLGHRFATGRLRRRVFAEEVPGLPTLQKRKVWREFEEPKVQEWTEQIEVTDEQQAQLLELVVDVSRSMDGTPICLAIALASVVMGAHLDDDSQYLYRQFAVAVGRLTAATTPAERRSLIKELFNQSNDLGGGTIIYTAIKEAASDVRSRARRGQAAEILLITDGDDTITREEVYDAIGEDVTLHTVIVGYPGNKGLKSLSTTHYELTADADGSNVKGATEGLYPGESYMDWRY